jgi:hypothetical protein
MKTNLKNQESTDDNAPKSVRLRKIRKSGSRTSQIRDKNSTVTDGNKSVK